MTVSEIGYAIRDDLRENVIDPIGRQGPMWIHYKPVPSDPKNIGKTPTVYIEPAVSSGGVQIIGTGKQHRRIRYRITVCGRIGDRGMIDGYPVTSAEELISRISDKIIDRISTNSAAFTTIGQPLASKTLNYNAGIEIIDGVGGVRDLSSNTKANILFVECMEDF